MFIDANIFIHAFDATGKKSELSARFIERVLKGEQKATTSPMVLNEVIYYFVNNFDAGRAEEICNNILSFQNLNILSVDGKIVRQALVLIKGGMGVTDAFHAATMKANNVETICSYDGGFDDIKGIKRQEPK